MLLGNDAAQSPKRRLSDVQGQNFLPCRLSAARYQPQTGVATPLDSDQLLDQLQNTAASQPLGSVQ